MKKLYAYTLALMLVLMGLSLSARNAKEIYTLGNDGVENTKTSYKLIKTGDSKFAPTPINYPVIEILGTSITGWGSGHKMTTTDGINYSAENLSLVQGLVKFRQDNSWSINWGSASFPVGSGIQNGANIPISSGGKYNITFNRKTGEYKFTPTPINYPVIEILGTSLTGWGSGHKMTTTDGINYTAKNLSLLQGLVKFRQDNSWSVNWGSANFPAGTGIQNGANIPISSGGKYNITFNRKTGEYKFAIIPDKFHKIEIGINTFYSSGKYFKYELTTTDGVNYFAKELALEGLGFFIQDDGIVQWGGNSFPNGIGIKDGSAITVSSKTGIYNISFNRETGEYIFIETPDKFHKIEIGINSYIGGPYLKYELTTKDGINYYAEGIASEGLAYFIQDDRVVWGGDSYPNGIGIKYGGVNPIIISSKTRIFNVSFNRETGEYKFTDGLNNFHKIDISVNSFISEGEDFRYELTTTDGINYFAKELALEGLGYFIQDDGVFWGGNDFPQGDITNSGPSIIIDKGFYNISFSRETGEYKFDLISVIQNKTSSISELNKEEIKFFPNPFQNTLNISGVNLGKEISIDFYNLAGNLVHSITNPSSYELNVSHLPNGVYIVHTNVNGETIINKLVKE